MQVNYGIWITIGGVKIGDVEVMTLAEAAQRTGLSPGTLVIQARKGVLRAQKIGKTYLVTVEDLDQYMRDHAGKPGRKPREPKVT